MSLKSSYSFLLLLIRLLAIQWLIMFKSVTSEFRLTIIHNNDFHANYLPMKANNNAECFENWDKNKDCVGGVARTVGKVKEIRQKFINNNENVLFLNAGDHFQGTSWYTLLKSKVVADFVHLMKHDVMTLGNHEFDDGPEELQKFVNLMNGTLPIVCCNVDFDKSLELHKIIQKSIVMKVNNVDVAIIGYLTPHTEFVSSPGKLVKFRDEIQAIQEEIQTLKAKHPHLNIFIGLGHSGYDRDIEIAEKVPDLDVIVGGHSHSYLYSGKNFPSIEKPEGPYPTIFEHAIKTSSYENNGTTLIVQAFAYGKYIGILNLTFNDAGQIVKYTGEPILMSHNIPGDVETETILRKFNDQLSIKYNETFGMATEAFIQNTCRSKECSLGNLITDSFVNHFSNLQKKEKVRQIRQSNNGACKLMALINGGNIRTSIDKGPITYRKLISVLPFTNNLGLLTVTGSELWDILKKSANQHDRGGFLQVSGVRVTFGTTSSKTVIKKSKLINVEAFCDGKWTPISKENTFQVVITNFLANGGDNYTINIKNWQDYQLVDRDILSEYIRKQQKITPILDNRIQFIVDNQNNSSQTLNYNLFLTFVIAILFFIKSSHI
uniref:5'-nucleotidase n=1 Tax=Dermatophagoides pteronyssinus TaxID=6956 RepID=A0A6P6Y0F9_DERPT|nr:protein 5NUC-like isoform X2 [Dermatophagoides pteronyssinus]